MCPYPHPKTRSRCTRSTSADGMVKYIHHSPKVSPVPARATSAASQLQPCDPTTAPSEATVPITVSPSVMIVSSPYRSAMCPACHGVPPLPRSAMIGPTSSITMSGAARTRNIPTVGPTSASSTQPSWATPIVSA